MRHSVYAMCEGSEKRKYLTLSGTRCFTKAHHLVTCTITLLSPTDCWLITLVLNPYPANVENMVSS